MTDPGPCPDLDLQSVLALAAQDPVQGRRAVEDLLGRHPGDARLHFLRGSLLAAKGDYPAGEAAMARAVELEPGFALARFQLGFVRLTSGDPAGAAEVWGPLRLEASDNPLRLFADGLEHMARDEFEMARTRLQAGIDLNLDNPALNRDMNLVLAELSRLAGGPDEGATSSAHWLLQQDAVRRTRH